jgi:hypothetical protein
MKNQVVQRGLIIAAQEVFTSVYGKDHPALSVATGLAVFAGAVLVWLLGRKLNGQPGKILLDPETGQTVEIRKRHTLFWIPMQWISLFWIAAFVAWSVGLF